MSQPPVPYLHREIQAKEELGRTDVKPRLAALFSGLFLGLIVAVPLFQKDFSPFPQLVREVSRAETNRRLVAALHGFETRLEETSWIVEDLLPPVQLAMTGWLEAGNPQVVPGEDGWLFYRPAVDSLTGPGFLEPDVLAARRLGGDAWEEPVQPDPRPALLALHRLLAPRGIRLLVLPVPVKASIHPGKLAGPAMRPIENPSFDELVQFLAKEGIEVLDVGPLLAEGGPYYLETDTHWNPAGVERTALALAASLPKGTTAYQEVERPVRGTGDLARLLELPPGSDLYPPQEVTVRAVLQPDGSPWRPDPAAEILLLGDSYTNVFSQDGLGWGTGAGLAERLSFHLRRPVDRIALNAGGAYASRHALARDLSRLEGKKLVIYEFSARELATGDWR